MCIILDANVFSTFKKGESADIKPILTWLNNRNGKIVYSTTKRFKEEWKKAKMDEWIIQMLTKDTCP